MDVKQEVRKLTPTVRPRIIGYGSVALLTVVLPFLLQSELYYLDTLILALLWASAAGAWNLAGGYGGLLSLGHAAFFGIGAYASSLMYVKLEVSPWIGMAAGAILAGVLGLVTGMVTLRMKGPFFALTTIAITEVLMIVAVNWSDLTNGSKG